MAWRMPYLSTTRIITISKTLIMNCHICGKESGTFVVCDSCAPTLTTYQRRKMDIIWHQYVVAAAKRVCSYCGTQYPEPTEDTPEMLTGDHIESKGSNPARRWDVSNGRCTDMQCHNKRHAGIVNAKNEKKQTDERTVKKVKREQCKRTPTCHLMPLSNGYCINHQ